MLKKKCDLCGSNTARFYTNAIDRFSGEEFTFIQCSQCGLIYPDPKPDLTDISVYYPTEYEAYYELDLEESPLEKYSLQQSLLRQLNLAEKYTSKKGEMLDIGCAKGNFLLFAKEHGWDVSGIEINHQAAKIAQSKYKLKVHSGTLESSNLPDKKFDLITLWDVLEHLPNPKSSLNEIHRLLKTGGLVVFSIPNLESFDRSIFKSNWIGWDPPRHFNLFTKETIKNLLDMSGFMLIDSKCITGGKGTFLLSLDILLRNKNYLKFIQFFYPIIGLILLPYRLISYKLRKGPIITYIAQKYES